MLDVVAIVQILRVGDGLSGMFLLFGVPFAVFGCFAAVMLWRYRRSGLLPAQFICGAVATMAFLGFTRSGDELVLVLCVLNVTALFASTSERVSAILRP
jgi:hypothetical protein